MERPDDQIDPQDLHRQEIEEAAEETQQHMAEPALPEPEPDLSDMQAMAETATEDAQLDDQPPPELPVAQEPVAPQTAQGEAEQESAAVQPPGRWEKAKAKRAARWQKPAAPEPDEVKNMAGMEGTAKGDVPKPKTQKQSVKDTEVGRAMSLLEQDAGEFETNSASLDMVQALGLRGEIDLDWKRLVTQILIDQINRTEQLIEMLERFR
jgi:hypothetical protein